MKGLQLVIRAHVPEKEVLCGLWTVYGQSSEVLAGSLVVRMAIWAQLGLLTNRKVFSTTVMTCFIIFADKFLIQFSSFFH